MIPDHQIGAVIRAYLKNKRDTLAKEVPASEGTEVEDEIRVSDQGKRILLERMGRRVAEKAQIDPSPP
jgi:hypothetical protein